jgi:hypothetical protein
VTRRQIGLVVLIGGIALFFLDLLEPGQRLRLFMSGLGLVLLLGGLCTFLLTLRGETVSRPHWLVIVVALLAVAFHVYENAFEVPGEFSVGWLLWALPPYGLCLVASAFSGTRTAAIAGALVALLFDLVVHYDVFMQPKDFTAALVLIFRPLWNTLIFSPAAIFIAWLFLHRRHRPDRDAP